MLSRWMTALLVATALSAAVPAMAQNEAELVKLIAAYSRELARVEAYLGWYDQLQRLEIAQGRGNVTEADTRLRARAQEVYQRSFSEADLEQVVTQHRQAAAAYLAQVERAVASAEPQVRARLLALLAAQRQQYESFVTERLDPLPTLQGVAAINARAQGQQQVTAALDPFAGQRERILAALPDPEVARLAQIEATLHTAASPPQPPPPAPTASPTPPAVAGAAPATSPLSALTWLGIDADRVGAGRDARPDGRRDGHFRLRLALPGVQEIRAIGVQPADGASNPVPGPRWSTRDADAAVLGVFFKDRQLNSGQVPTMGRFRDRFELDLYVSDAGSFRPGQNFAVAVELGDGSMHRRLVQLSAPVDPTARPVPGEMGARPVPGEMTAGVAPKVAPLAAQGGNIVVVEATYGPNCGVRPGNVTEHLAKACNGRPQCDYTIDVRVIGDPASGCAKTYVAQWECPGQPGRRSATAAAEAGYGSRVSLSCAGAAREMTVARPVPGEMTATTPRAAHEPPARLEVGIDRPGADFATIALPPQSTPEVCRKLCDEAPQCRAFTYVRPGVQGAQPMCWLKTSVPEQVARDCCVSGTR